jgi:hypothetical protein
METKRKSPVNRTSTMSLWNTRNRAVTELEDGLKNEARVLYEAFDL